MHNLRAMKWALMHGPDKPLERFALVVFAGHKNFETGTAWPTAATVAKLTGMSLRGVRNSISALVEQGFLQVEERGGGQRGATRYIVRTGEEAERQAPEGNENSAPGAPLPSFVSARGAPLAGSVSAHGAPLPGFVSARGAPLAGSVSAPQVTVSAPQVAVSARGAPDIIEIGKNKKKERVAHELPDAWEPSEAGLQFAAGKGIENVREEVEKFRDRHRARGNRFKCWDAAWREWCRRAPEFRPTGGGKGSVAHRAAVSDAERRVITLAARAGRPSGAADF